MSRPKRSKGVAPSTWEAPTLAGFFRDLVAAFREWVKP